MNSIYKKKIILENLIIIILLSINNINDTTIIKETETTQINRYLKKKLINSPFINN